MAAAPDANPAIQNPAYRPAGTLNSAIIYHSPRKGGDWFAIPNASLSLMMDKFRIAGSVLGFASYFHPVYSNPIDAHSAP